MSEALMAKMGMMAVMARAMVNVAKMLAPQKLPAMVV
jgi:hypothetical protein